MTVPFPYQLESVERIQQHLGRALVSLDMGLGKSFISLLHAQQNPDRRPIVVVCPASLKWNWEKEAKVHINMRAEVLEGRKPPRGRIWTQHQLIILNYDILAAWVPYLLRLKPQLLIIDESQYCINAHAQRTKAVKKLSRAIPQVLALSGTPLLSKPSELFPILNILWPDRFPSFTDFAFRHCSPQRKPWGWEFKGAVRLPELHEKLTAAGMIRYRKADVLQQLPAKQRVVVPLPIEHRQEYQTALNDFLRWMRQEFPAKLRRARKAEELVKTGYLKRLVARLKMRAVYEWIDNYLTGSSEKLLLFAIHRKAVELLHERYPHSAIVTGSVVGKDRQLAFDRFHHDPDCCLLIGNIRAAGTGWSCSATATTAFMELDWTPGVHVQAEDRCHGIGRGREGIRSTVYYLIARDTIEDKLCGILQTKMEVINKVLDAGMAPDSLSVHDLLMEAMLA